MTTDPEDLNRGEVVSRTDFPAIVGNSEAKTQAPRLT